MMLAAFFFTLVFGFSLVSRRVERTWVTAPMVFTLSGVLLPMVIPGMDGGNIQLSVWLHIAEIGLVLLLFTDASHTNLGVLKNIRSLPIRLLSSGMLLTLFLGMVLALWVFPQLSLWEAGILAAILAPTDAGLGQIIVNSPQVPMKIRQALNVEAGLNDGLSVPFLLFFIALASSASGDDHAGLARFITEQLGYGILVGTGIGLLGGWLLGAAIRAQWMAKSWCQLGVVVLPVLCIGASNAVGASMFIASFVAGLAVQVGYKNVAAHSVEFTEEWGQLLNLSVFFLFGLLVCLTWSQFTFAHGMYALLSLTVIRMLPVALALAGTRLSRATVLFIGWFGPRGLASIVLGMVYLEHETHQSGESTIRLAVMVTVLVSIFVHGLSAVPGMTIYAKKIRTLSPEAPEFDGVEQGHTLARPSK